MGVRFPVVQRFILTNLCIMGNQTENRLQKRVCIDKRKQSFIGLIEPEGGDHVTMW
jgi:hypothetical protein